MNVSAAIADLEVRIQYGIFFSRHDHTKGARPRKRGDDAPVSPEDCAISRRTVMNNAG
jgi:hypothetical protein